MKMPEPVAHALKWPSDARLNLGTVFDTEQEASDYAQQCTDGVTAHPLYDKQALIDLLEEAAKECENRDSGQGLREDLEDIACAAAVRKLKETL